MRRCILARGIDRGIAVHIDQSLWRDGGFALVSAVLVTAAFCVFEGVYQMVQRPAMRSI